MGWTTLANSTTADATEVDGSLRHIGEGTLLPRSGTAMAATDAALDLGNTATSWRDVHLDRDLYARSIRGQANFAGYIEWSSSPFTSVFGSVTANSGPVVIIPPFKAEINGQTYVHAATTTLDFATTTSWLSGQSGMTASTFVWVYAVPTTTGDAVVRLDDINPSQTFSTITGGLYHISTTSNPSRAIHAMRINSSNIMLRYHRTGNDIRYIPHSTTAIPSSDGISHSTWSSVITFSDIPNFLRTRRIYTNFDYFKSTTTSMSIRVFYTNDTAHSIGTTAFEDFPTVSGNTQTMAGTVVGSGNSSYFRWTSANFNTSAAATVRVRSVGYNLEF